MKLTLNGKTIEVNGGLSLSELMGSQGFPEKGIAAAVNGKVVRRVDWATTMLAENDSITVIKAVCGG